ncbi:hypothetical protein [Faecalibaculum rodentium]
MKKPAPMPEMTGASVILDIMLHDKSGFDLIENQAPGSRQRR